MDYAAIIKQSLGMKDVCEQYGIDVNSRGFACCPFHNEKTPSMKVYGGDRGWYCFGCGENGDVITFVMKLFSIDFKTAIQKLNEDFSLNLKIGNRITRREKTSLSKRAYEIKKQRELSGKERDDLKREYHEALSEYIRLDQNRLKYAPKQGDEDWHPLFTESLRKMSHAEYNLDIAETRFFEYERTH